MDSAKDAPSEMAWLDYYIGGAAKVVLLILLGIAIGRVL